MEKQKTIKEFTDIELKAMKSDIYEQNQVNASNLQVINTELDRRTREILDTPKEETKEEKKNK